MAKVGRNEPCPCGSGRKYKRCCLGKEGSGLTLPLPPLQSVSRKGEKTVYSFADPSDPWAQTGLDFLGEGAEDLTDDLIAELVGRGWPEADLKKMRAEGAKYNRDRDSIVYPPEPIGEEETNEHPDPGRDLLIEDWEEDEELLGPAWSSDYAWCLHCARTYKRGEFRLVDDCRLCPYEDCDTSILLDSWNWDAVRSNHPEYPEIPERGKVYPLY